MKNIDYCNLKYQDVWDTLSIIDVTDHIQKKNNLSYLSWAWAWQVLMENYPESRYEFHENEYHKDNSGTVSCTIYIGELSRYMWLPVMTGFNNKAQANPDARGFGDARMRCLVKCMGMFGLGFYIYAGEDLPQSNERTREASQQKRAEYKAQQSDATQHDEEMGAYYLDDTDKKSDMPRAIEEVMDVFLEDVTTIEQLKEFWTENKKALKVLERDDSERYGILLSSFKAKKAEIMQSSTINGEA